MPRLGIGLSLSDCRVVATAPGGMSFLLLEDGFFLLLEDGSRLILE